MDDGLEFSHEVSSELVLVGPHRTLTLDFQLNFPHQNDERVDFFIIDDARSSAGATKFLVDVVLAVLWRCSETRPRLKQT